jgi:hypothetical protein
MFCRIEPIEPHPRCFRACGSLSRSDHVIQVQRIDNLLYPNCLQVVGTLRDIVRLLQK